MRKLGEGIAPRQVIQAKLKRGPLQNSVWPKYHADQFNTSQSAYGGSNGILQWTFRGGYPGFESSPAIASDGTIYIGCDDFNVYAVNPDGSMKWSYETSGKVVSSPAIDSNGVVYVGSEDDNLYAINPNGTLKWAFGTGGMIEDSPNIDANGNIYFGSDDDNLYSISPSGIKNWSFTTGDSVKDCPAIDHNGAIVFGSDDRYLYKLSGSGVQIWANLAGAGGYASPVVAPDNSIYFTGAPGNGQIGNSIERVDTNGNMLAGYSGNAEFPSTLALGSNGDVYVNCFDENLYALDANLNVLWTAPIHEYSYGSPAIGSDGTVYFGSGDHNIYAFNSGGSFQWALATGSGIVGSPAIGSDGTVYIGSTDYLLYAVNNVYSSVSLSSVGVNPTSVVGGGTSTGTVVLSSPAPSIGDIVYLSTDDPSASVPASITIPSGQTTGTFTVTTSVVSTNTWVNVDALSAGAYTSAALEITVPGIASLTIMPSSVNGGGSATGTVYLDGPALSGGWNGSLYDLDPSVVTIPSSLFIPAGQSSGTFNITTVATANTITDEIEAYDEYTSQTEPFTVNGYGLSGLTLNPASVVGGNGSVGTVTLGAPAPSGGWKVNLSSTNPSLAAVPPNVTVSTGATSAIFEIVTVKSNKSNNVTINATDGVNPMTAVLTVTGDSIATLSLSPSTIGGLGSSTGTITLTSAAPAGGWPVNLKVGAPSYVTCPASVTIPAGATSATFNLTGTGQHSFTLNVGVFATDAVSGHEAILTIQGDSTAGLSLSPTTIGWDGTSTGTVSLTSPAPSGGWLVQLHAGASGYVTMPASVLVQAGSTTASFTITGTTQRSGTVNMGIFAADGGSSSEAILTLTGDRISGVSLAPSTIGWSGTSTGTVTLTSAAPSGGWVVTLKAGSPGYVQMPASVVVPTGATSASFTITGTGQHSFTLNLGIIANDVGSQAEAILTLTGDSLKSLTLNPSSVAPGGGATGTVTLNSPAPSGGWVVKIAVGAPAYVGVPSSVTVPAGASTATFPVTTKATDPATGVVVIAGDGSTQVSAILTIT